MSMYKRRSRATVAFCYNSKTSDVNKKTNQTKNERDELALRTHAQARRLCPLTF